MLKDLLAGDMERYYGHRPSTFEFIKYFIHPRTQAVGLFRLSQWFSRKGIIPLAQALELFNMIVWNCELSHKMEVGRGLRILHTLGVGLAFASAGENLTVNVAVIVAGGEHDDEFDLSNRPRFGNNVTIHLGARIFGGITVGDNVIIGAHTLVNRSVPANCVVAGCPARIIRHLPGYVQPPDPESYCKDITKQEKHL
ncbi:MAG TPA: hypothetical protein PLM29_07280 [Deltaproteobacteria bacterium]|nr:hypothetical protein [Deltaproteobacteria bacterium]